MAPSLESADIARLAQGSHGDPFSVLGRHASNDKEIFRCFLPRSRNAWIEDENQPMSKVEGSDLFEFLAEPGAIPAHYR
ncbi:MAG: hypothetical protein ACE1Y4_10515, partial [Lysobacterales bacterium]